MEIIKIENSKIQKTDFEKNISLQVIARDDDGDIYFRLRTFEYCDIKVHSGIEKVYNIFTNLIGDIKRCDDTKYLDEYRSSFIVVKNDLTLSKIVKKIKTEPFYEYYPIDDIDKFKDKATFVAVWEGQGEDGYYRYSLKFRTYERARLTESL